MIEIEKTHLPGCWEIIPRIHLDKRGLFIKTFHREVFKQKELATDFAEEYYSFSYYGVLRGLHFQTPPLDHIKIVYCVHGEVMDAIVDLRVGSPTYGMYQTVSLSSKKGNMLYIPSGLAHGFYVLSESAIMMYKTTTVYSPENDSGILWSSVGIPWPKDNPIISDRDKGFITFSHFKSPFKYKREENDYEE